MVLISHPTGNTFVAAALRGLRTAGQRYFFHTTLGFTESQSLPTILPSNLRRELERRRFPVRAEELGTRPARELTRLVAARVGLQALVRGEHAWASVQSVYCDLDAHVAAHHLTSEVSAVYAYEDGAASTFAAARKRGIPTIYDLPIAYWELRRDLLREELERWPEWAATMPGNANSEAKLQRKTEELELADAIVCPSKFVYDSLPAQARTTKHCLVAEFGSPVLPPLPPTERPTGGPLRVLFAGSMTQRKGLADVFAAMKILARTDVELVVLGSPVAPSAFYRQQYANFTYAGPRPHRAVLELMASCDLLVLPSLAEGRALVQQEAMSCGLPILVTPNAGGEDLVEEGVTGFLVPIRAPEQIAARISWCADHRSAVQEMGRAAQAKAAQYSWETYGRRVVAFIEEMIGTSHVPSVPAFPLRPLPPIRFHESVGSRQYEETHLGLLLAAPF